MAYSMIEAAEHLAMVRSGPLLEAAMTLNEAHKTRQYRERDLEIIAENLNTLYRALTDTIAAMKSARHVKPETTGDADEI